MSERIAKSDQAIENAGNVRDTGERDYNSFVYVIGSPLVLPPWR